MISFATEKLRSLHIFCLKNKAFISRVVKQLVVVACLIPVSAAVAETQEEFVGDNFSLTIPAAFERQENSAALIVLRHKTQGFPTFNAVLSPGPWSYSGLSAEQQGQKLLDEYHLVGLKNARLESSVMSILDSKTVLQAALHYKIGESELSSEVWILSYSDRYLALTAVYRETALQEDRAIIKTLLQGLRIKPELANIRTPQGNSSQTQSTSNDSRLSLSIILGLSSALLILFIVWKLFKNR